MNTRTTPPFPARLTLELTNRCNLRCVFCPRRFMEKERGDMDVSLALALLDEATRYAPVVVVPFFRGETLLHPEWDRILSGVKSRGVGPIQMATNASLLHERNSRRILEIGVDFLSFSLDTLDGEKYARLRGADFAVCMENIHRFLELRRELKAGTQVQVSAVETAENREEMEAFVAYWRPRVDRVRIYVEHSSSGSLGGLADPPLPRESRQPCHKPFEDMVVYWNGDVALCNHDWTRRVTGQHIGNVRDAGIGAIWNGPAYRRIRQAHLENQLHGIAPCETCDHWSTSYTPQGYWGRSYDGTGSGENG